jgi:hypothetical protein
MTILSIKIGQWLGPLHAVFASERFSHGNLVCSSPHIHIMDLPRSEFFGSRDIVDGVGVAAVDQDVSRSRGGTSSAIVSATIAAGTINRSARGFANSAKVPCRSLDL